MSLSPIAHLASDGTRMHALVSIDALRTLTPAGRAALAGLGVRTVGELLHWWPVLRARLILAYARGEIAHDVSLDRLLVSAARAKPAADLGREPVTSIVDVDTTIKDALATHFSVTTIEELAEFKPYLEATRFLRPASLVFDEPASCPDELMPKPIGAVASTRVFASFVREKHVELDGFRLRLDQSRQHTVDVALASLFLHDANLEFRLGYTARHKQRWINVGTVLGEVRKTLELAPNQPKTVAVVDWYRRVAGSRNEDTTVDERLSASLVHTRALDEVTTATAIEHQSGGTQIDASSLLMGAGVVAGSAVVGGVAGAIGVGIAGALTGAVVGSAAAGVGAIPGAVIGAGIGIAAGAAVGVAGGAAAGSAMSGSFGTQKGVIETDSSGDRSLVGETHQRITDSTVQNASSVRSLRSTIVFEETQQESQQATVYKIKNYNHAHTLNIMYYEILQRYRVEIGLDAVEPFVLVPFNPLTFSIDLVVRYWDILKRGIPDQSLVRAFEDTLQAISAAITSDQQRTSARLRRMEVTLSASAQPFTLGGFSLRLAANGSPAHRRFFSGQGSLHYIDLSDVTPAPDAVRGFTVEGMSLGFDPLSPHGSIGGTLQYNSSASVVAEFVSSDGMVFRARDSFNIVMGSCAVDLERMLDALAAAPPSEASIERVLRYMNERRFSFTRLLLQSIEHEQLVSLVEALLIDAGGSGSPVFPTRGSTSTTSRRTSTRPLELMSNVAYVLDGLTLVGPNAFLAINASRHRRLVEFIEPEPVAFVGNTVMFKLLRNVPSNRTTGTFQPLAEIAQYSGALRDWFVKHHRGVVTRGDLIDLPTPGLFAEGVLGRSNCAEKLDITRYIKYDDLGITDDGPRIADVSMESRKDPTTQLAPTVTGAVLNVSPTTSMPDPDRSLLSGVTAPFRDMSGRDTLASVLANLSGATERIAAHAGGLAGAAADKAFDNVTALATTLAGVAGTVANTAGGMAQSSLSSVGASLNQLLATPSASPSTSAPPSGPAPGPGGTAPPGSSGGPSTDSSPPGTIFASTASGRDPDVLRTLGLPAGDGSTLFASAAGGGSGAAAALEKIPWILEHSWTDTVPDQTYDFREAFHRWVAASYSGYDGAACLCNWYPITLLIEFASAHSLRVRLKYWPGRSSTTDGPREWDTSKVLTLDSHDGRYASKDEFLHRARSTVTARMIGTLNSAKITLSSAQPGDMLLYDSSDRYWHVAVIIKKTATDFTFQSGHTPPAIPRSREYTKSAVPSGVFEGAPRVWNFGQMD
ncbi:MAG: hypothetical protein RBS39_13420 [Phycisphaerales bacterium]|nr:hypothetical protein [Phycisphaerales bacterium]